jgi:NADH-quinone oxidoreductase subunit E
MLFTLETVSCLGACGLAPAVVINDDVHGMMTPETTIELIDKIIEDQTNA